jgi:macrolide transport system ATP-binding/permease protein
MWWQRMFRRGTYEDELEKELRAHLELHTNDLIAEGCSPEEARRRARLALGGPEQVKESCRDVRSTRLLSDLLQDVRYGVRILARRPGFTSIAALTLGLGIGVNTAILSAVHGFVLRPLAVADAEALVTPYWGRKADEQVWNVFSFPNFRDLREQNETFSDLCAAMPASAGVSSSESRNAGGDDRAEVHWGELVSGNFFDVMGVEPMLGRGFLPEEAAAPNGHPVVVLGHSLWRRRFKGDEAIVGRTVYLNGKPFTVVGVMPESFFGSKFYLRQAFWAPLAMGETFGRRAEWRTDRGYASFNLYGRLKPGVTMAQAEADLNRVGESLAAISPKDNADTKIQLTTELDSRYEGATRVIRYGGLMAVCVSALVLLLACANVANLMLARAVTRTREIGIRLAIGAGRGRIVRQLLTESVLLALLGGALGWAFAYWGAWLIQASVPPVPYPISFDFAPDAYVLKWMLAVSLATGVIFGLAPAALASRTDLVAVINGMTLTPPRGRRWSLHGTLVVAQVTISIVVLVCAGLFIRSLGKARETDPGFRAETLATMMVNLDSLGYDQAAIRRFYPELQRGLETQPGVRAASLASEIPLLDSRPSRGPIVKEGELDPPPNQGVHSECSFVAPKYFETLQTPLVRGRDFTDRDDADAPPVVIVNQEFARRFYGDEESAMGRRFRFSEGTPLMEIVGIAKDGRYGTLYEDPQPYMFLPVYQHLRARMTVLVSAHSAGDLDAVVESVRGEVARLDARLGVFGVMIGEENLSLAYWGPKVAAGIATTFGVLALVLATTGLYSVMTYTVSQRTHEIGIRMALGADLRNVRRLIVGQGLRMVVVGIAFGLAGAIAMTQLVAGLLLGVGATDLATFAGVSGLVVAVALLACYLPARRATRVDPLVALRHD